MRWTIGLLLLLGACSGGDEPAAEGERGRAAPATPPAQEASAEPDPVDSNATPRLGELRTFKDWAVGCDNLRTCMMASLGPEGGDWPVVTMAVRRVAGPDGAVEIVAGSRDEDALSLAVDGKVLAGDPRAQAALIAHGRTLTASSGDRVVGSVSLAGAAAALRWMDAQQGLAGTPAAFVAKGSGPVPPAPAAPVILAVAPAGSPATPTAEQIAAARRDGRCGDHVAANELLRPETHALGGGKTLLLLPCSVGAYNLMSAVLVGDANGFAPAEFDAESGMGPEGNISAVVNGSWEDGLLTSHAKGRGLGDCGVRQHFAWDGRRFRLVEQAAMGECRGNPTLIPVWRAEVTRR